jgi:hypothetical protein
MQRHDVAGGEVATAMRIIGSIGSREFGQEAVQGSVVVAAATGWPASFTVAGGQLRETGWRNRVLLPLTSGSVQLACAWDVVFVADANTLHELRHIHSDQPQHHSTVFAKQLGRKTGLAWSLSSPRAYSKKILELETLFVFSFFFFFSFLFSSSSLKSASWMAG